jgi:hypothetical protein
MITMTAPSQVLTDHLATRGFESHGEIHLHIENGQEKNRRLLIRALDVEPPLILQLEVVLWSDPDISGWTGNISNFLNDNDESFDHIDSIGMTPEQAMYSLVTHLPSCTP